MKMIQIDESFQNVLSEYNYKKDVFTGVCELVLDDDQFNEWLHKCGLTSDVREVTWDKQKPITLGSYNIGRFWDSENDYLSTKNIFKIF